jgi:iron(III) transport system permease protein
VSRSILHGGGPVLGVAILVLLVLVGYPLLWLLLGAVGLPDEVGLDHFVRVYTRTQNFEPLTNTLILALGTGLLSVVLGVPLAWAAARSNVPLRRSIHALVALSYITPPYLTALAYIILLGPDAGYFNRILRWALGLEAGPFDVFSMGGIIFVIGIHVFPFTYFLTYTALQRPSWACQPRSSSCRPGSTGSSAAIRRAGATRPPSRSSWCSSRLPGSSCSAAISNAAPSSR